MFYLKPCRVGIIKDVAENPKGEQEFEGVLDRSCVCRSQQVTPGLGRGFKKRKKKELRSSLPAPVWSQVDKTPETEFAFTAASVPSGSPSNQTDCVKIFRSHQRRIHWWGALWTQPPSIPERDGGGEQTVITNASVFGLWLLLPQNKYVLKGRVFTDITAYQRPQAAFELSWAKNSLGSLPPRRRARSMLRNSAFLKHNITAHVLVPKTFPKQENLLDFPVKDKNYLECMNVHIWCGICNSFCVLVCPPHINCFNMTLMPHWEN